MNRTISTIACLLTTLAGASGGAGQRPGKHAGADLPPLLEFLDGSPVHRVEDWTRRKEEIRRLMCQTFVGTYPEKPPAILEAEVLEQQPDDGSARRRVKLTFDTKNKVSLETWVWIPKGKGPFPILLTAPRHYQIGWAEEALSRGYLVCLYPGVDSHHREKDYPGYDRVWETFRAEYPEATWTEISTKAWLASRCLDYLLDPRYGYNVAPGQIGIIGHSRYGKQALIAAAFDGRITAVVARSPGSPGSCAYRFSSRTTFAEAPADFPGQWFLSSLRAYTGRENELPIDAHGWMALIAPRRCLIHTAQNDDCEPTFAVERSYLEARKVYRLLGRPENLRVHYRAGGHDPITDEHRRQNLDWFDLSFGRGTVKVGDFPEELIHQFDWEAWRARQVDEDLEPPPPLGTEADRRRIVERIEWALGKEPDTIAWEGKRTFLTPEESALMTHDRWRVPGVARLPVSFGANVRGNVYYSPGVKKPAPAVIWLHPYSYASGYNEGYGVEGTTVYHRLAEQGYVVLAYDQCGFGLRLLEGRDFYKHHPRWSRLGRMVHDVRAAVDFLRDGKGAAQGTMPAVDRSRICLLGYSLGGMVGLYAAALDERIAGVASFCGFTPLRTDTNEKPTGGNRRLYQWHALQPKLGLFEGREERIPYDFDHVLSLIAPRPCLIYAPKRDRHATFQEVDACVGRAKAAWAATGQPGGLTSLTPDDINRFQSAQQQVFLKWLAGVPARGTTSRSQLWHPAPATISRNDVLYVTPSVEPWEAMPVGGGDLSAMVRSDGGGLDLHLTKSDAWGFQALPDAPPGSRFFNNVSPGHVRLEFGGRARAAAARRFRQRLDLYHGSIRIQLGKEADKPGLEIWGHPERKILVVEITDPRGVLEPATIELAQWRPTMKPGAADTTVHATEVHARPARPHLANTGLEDYFDAKSDPLLGRGTAVVLGSGNVRPKSCSAEAKKATMILPRQRPQRYYLVIAAAVTTDGEPLAAARRELEAALAVPLETLKAEQRAWWRDYWGKSALRIQSPDKMADWLCAAYHVHLYTLGCVNRGPVPCKWDGGAGLMRGDERTWGLSEWVQEIRFTYLPLYAANRLEMARGLTRHYSQMRPYLLEQTRRMWGVDGLWIPETVLPWGHAEDFVLKDTGQVRAGHLLAWDPKTAPYGKFERYNGYVGFLFTAGLETCQHYLTYYRYSGDERYLRDEAYPMLRDVCRFVSGLLRKEADGRWHLDPANALETWWMVRDPADTLAGIQAVFPEFVRLSEQYGQDTELRTRCAAILAALPEPTLGHWSRDGTIDPKAKTYAPAAAKGQFPTSRNFEVPALYRVFPFGLSGFGAPDYDLACNTFRRRIFGITNSWSLDPIWAARLGLPEEACKLLGEHAVRYNRFRYGGWDSSNSSVFPGGLSVVPYTDGAGLSAFGINEVLLQSHNGLIRILPAVSKSWSGIFRLRAEGGFLVAADFAEGKARRVGVQSLLGRRCRIRNPWDDTCIVRTAGHVAARSDAATVEFDTQTGNVYLLEPASQPVSEGPAAPITDTANQQPGLPGRDNRQ